MPGRLEGPQAWGPCVQSERQLKFQDSLLRQVETFSLGGRRHWEKRERRVGFDVCSVTVGEAVVFIPVEQIPGEEIVTKYVELRTC